MVDVASVVVSAVVDSVVVFCASVSFEVVVASVVCSVEATVVSVVEAAVVVDAVVSSGVLPQPAKRQTESASDADNRSAINFFISASPLGIL